MIFGILMTIAGSALIAVYRILMRTLMRRDTEKRPAESVLLGSIWTCAALTLFVIFLASGGTGSVEPGFWRAVAITGACNVAIAWCGLRALADPEAPVSLTVPILDTTPAAVIMTSWLVTGEFPNALGYAGILLLVAGTYGLNIHAAIEELKQGWSWRAVFAPFIALKRISGVRYAFAGALIGCVAISFDGVASRTGHPLLAASCIVSVPAVVHTGRSIAGGKARQFFDRRRAMPWGAALGFMLAGAVGLYFYSFRLMLVSYQATIKRTETLFVFFLAWMFLGERKHFGTRLGAIALLIAGAILITVSGR